MQATSKGFEPTQQWVQNRLRESVAEVSEGGKLSGLAPVTYSALSTFRNCRRKYFWRQEKELVSDRPAEPLWVGALWHDMKEAVLLSAYFPKVGAKASVMDGVSAALGILAKRCVVSSKMDADSVRRIKLMLTAMLREYVYRWFLEQRVPPGQEHVAESKFITLAVEAEFASPIFNPDTGARSRTFCMRGKVDRILWHVADGMVYLDESKTASTIDGGYLAKLWTDAQIQLYSLYLSSILGVKVGGVLYDIATKTMISPKSGSEESDEDFEARIAKFKKEETREKHRAAGKKIRVAETDEEFMGRLQEYYGTPDSLHRTFLHYSADNSESTAEDLWEVGQQLLDARKRNRWSKNQSQCFVFNRPCDYEPICRSGCSYREDLPDTLRNLYVTRRQHSELSPVGASASGELLTPDDVPF